MRISQLVSILFILVITATGYRSEYGWVAEVDSILRPQLSADARVDFPHSPMWKTVTARWDPFSTPTLLVSVAVANVGDVQATVKFASARRIKLLVTNTSHGFAKSLETVMDGIQLYVRAFNGVVVDAERNIATVGGGVIGSEFISALSAAGKRSATGNCDCVGMVGLGLGGGHGRMQGLYGLVSDNILSARLVVANGSLITVSAGRNSDLFWALRGAGHNFGVVVEFESKIYDRTDVEEWKLAEFVFDDEKLEDVFSFLEEYRNGFQSKETTIFVSFVSYLDIMDPLSNSSSRIRVTLQYGGHREFETITAPFLALSPLFSTTNKTVPWHGIAAAQGIGVNTGLCLHKAKRRAHFSALTKSLNQTAIRLAKKFFDEELVLLERRVNTNRRSFSSSSMVWELYPLVGVKALPDDFSSYPHRDLDILALLMINYTDKSNDALAVELGMRGREILQQGKQLRVYTNYAQGDEGNVAVYGGSSGTWRLQRLRTLKRKYDPEGLFGAYNPIETKPGITWIGPPVCRYRFGFEVDEL